MTTKWSMLEEASKNDELNYSVYRCPNPTAVNTGEPWYNQSNICPCDPNLSNSSGRGFTSCPMGIQEKSKPENLPMSQLTAQMPKPGQAVGSLYSNKTVPPQMWPRQLVRVGQSWRSAN
jgi:hypothetical protein